MGRLWARGWCSLKNEGYMPYGTGDLLQLLRSGGANLSGGSFLAWAAAAPR